MERLRERLELGLSEGPSCFRPRASKSNAPCPAGLAGPRVPHKPERRFPSFLFEARQCGPAAVRRRQNAVPVRIRFARPHTATQGRPLLVIRMLTIVSHESYLGYWRLTLHSGRPQSQCFLKHYDRLERRS